MMLVRMVVRSEVPVAPHFGCSFAAITSSMDFQGASAFM